MIPVPALHAYEASGKVDQVLQCPCHWAEHAWNTLLTRHAGVHAHLWPSAGTTPEGIDA